LHNNKPSQPEYTPPDSAIESFARCLLPTIQAYYDSEEGQHEFAEWKKKKGERLHHIDDSRTGIVGK